MTKQISLDVVGIVKGQMFMMGADKVPDSVGSPKWRAWLSTARRFSVDLGYIKFSVRREMVRGLPYFYAYKRIGGKLVKRYAGMEQALTLPRLIEIGQWYARAQGYKPESEMAV